MIITTIFSYDAYQNPNHRSADILCLIFRLRTEQGDLWTRISECVLLRTQIRGVSPLCVCVSVFHSPVTNVNNIGGIAVGDYVSAKPYILLKRVNVTLSMDKPIKKHETNI